MARNKGNYRLYDYDRMGGLQKSYRGNKGHDHPTLKEAREQAKIRLNKLSEYRRTLEQVLIIRYASNWNSQIVEILSKERDNEIRQVKV